MRLIQKSALTALIALALVAPVPAQLVESDESSRSAAAADTSRIRIENFGRIIERY
jgi:hypothetical protein